MSVLQRLNQVFQDVFEDDELNVNSHYSAKDLDDWDSLMHVSLILATESEFNVRFSSSEVTSLNDVGQFVELIESKLE